MKRKLAASVSLSSVSTASMKKIEFINANIIEINISMRAQPFLLLSAAYSLCLSEVQKAGGNHWWEVSDAMPQLQRLTPR